MTTTKINRVGNSASVRLTREVLRASGLSVDQNVVVDAEEGRVVIRAANDLASESGRLARECVGRYRRTLEKLGE